jgi:hypothetical protein
MFSLTFVDYDQCNVVAVSESVVHLKAYAETLEHGLRKKPRVYKWDPQVERFYKPGTEHLYSTRSNISGFWEIAPVEVI